MTGTNQPSDTGDYDGARRDSSGSAVLGAIKRVPAWVRGSRLYEWLTAEPEPEVIVIDLRETYTVGPFIRLLDAVVDRLQPYWEESTPKRLLDAAVRAGERAAETHLYIAGDGPLRDDLERQARSADLGNAVTFLGFVPEAALPGIYASADLFVLPTTVLEGFGLATLEALASGTPVVGTNVGGTPEILRPLTEQLPNAPSLLVNDTTQLADRLAAWSACSPAVQSQAGTTAREYVCSELTWEQTTDEIEAVFREVET